jgi:FMN phosphatase YigB (HAD superfamily)
MLPCGRLGVRDLFVETYGTDLVDTWKGSRNFYDEIFSHAGVLPSKVLIVDDAATSIQWAGEAGASGVLISNETGRSAEALTVLTSLAELPGFLASFES